MLNQCQKTTNNLEPKTNEREKKELNFFQGNLGLSNDPCVKTVYNSFVTLYMTINSSSVLFLMQFSSD